MKIIKKLFIIKAELGKGLENFVSEIINCSLGVINYLLNGSYLLQKHISIKSGNCDARKTRWLKH